VKQRFTSRVILIFSVLIVVTSAAFSGQRAAVKFISKSMAYAATDPYLASLSLRKAIKASPRWDYPYILLGNLYDVNMVFTLARETYKKALKIGIKQHFLRYKVYLSLAGIYCTLGKPDMAVKYYEKARSMRSGNRAIKIKLILLKLFKNALNMEKTNSTKSIQIYKRILRNDPGFIAAGYKIGLLLERQARLTAALNAFERVYSSLPVRTVGMQGSFTAWNKGILRFHLDPRTRDRFSIRLRLPPGLHQYKLVLNSGSGKAKKILHRENKNARLGAADMVNLLDNNTGRFKTMNLVYHTLPMDNFYFKIFKKMRRLAKILGRRKRRPRPYFGEKYAGRGKRITMKYYAPFAYSVYVVSSYNFWGGNVSKENKLLTRYYWPMKGPDRRGYWSLNIRLPLGFFHYKFVVNGKEPYYMDPVNLKGSGDFRWGGNSVYQVGVLGQIRWNEILRERRRKRRKVHLFGENLEYGKTVLFKYRNRKANVVYLIGTFNDWGINFQYYPFKHYMMEGPNRYGIWWKKVKLLPGTHHYKFIVDGYKAVHDKKNKNVEIDILQGKESVVKVKGKKPVLYRSKGLFGEDLKHGVPVKFRFKANHAKSVWVCGAFNKWGGTALGKTLSSEYYYAMTGPDKNRYWSVTVKLPAGRYQYKFVINGSVWIPDPENGQSLPDNHGGKNSVVIVSPDGQVKIRTQKKKVRFIVNAARYRDLFKKNRRTGLFEMKDPVMVKVKATFTKFEDKQMKFNRRGRYWYYDVVLKKGLYRYYFLPFYKKGLADGEIYHDRPYKTGNYEIRPSEILVHKKSKIRLIFRNSWIKKFVGIYMLSNAFDWKISTLSKLDGNLRTGKFSIDIETSLKKVEYKYIIRVAGKQDHLFIKYINKLGLKGRRNVIYFNDLHAESYKKNPFGSFNSVRKVK